MSQPTVDLNFEKELWETAVTLRGTVSPGDYKHYVLPLLSLRYISLRFEQRRQSIQVALLDPASEYYTGDPETDADILADPGEYERENVFVIPEEAAWDALRRHARADDIKLRIDNAIKALEEKYPQRLGGVMPRIYASSNLTVDQVAGLINLFSKDKFAAQNGADLLGRTYEYFITNFADTEGNRGGEFFTPRSVVALLVEILAPTQGIVFDPASGSGGMFVQSARFTYGNGKQLSFYGQESIENTLRLARMNLILHGLSGDIRLGNSLLDDKHAALKADYVIANPPFNLKLWGADKLDPKDARLRVGYTTVSVTNSNANTMWMLHFLHHLADGGTAGYVMANGAMTTNVAQEKEVRKALVEEGFVDCIIQMPDRLFFGTGIPCCLWFLSKNRTGSHGYRARREEILFIDARQLGAMVTRRQRVLGDEEIHRIAGVYHAWRGGHTPSFSQKLGVFPAQPGVSSHADIPGFCKQATLDEVRGHDYKLTPGIYVGTEAEEEDGESYAEKMPRLVGELQALFAESNRLQQEIAVDMDDLL